MRPFRFPFPTCASYSALPFYHLCRFSQIEGVLPDGINSARNSVFGETTITYHVFLTRVWSCFKARAYTRAALCRPLKIQPRPKTGATVVYFRASGGRLYRPEPLCIPLKIKTTIPHGASSIASRVSAALQCGPIIVSPPISKKRKKEINPTSAHKKLRRNIAFYPFSPTRPSSR